MKKLLISTTMLAAITSASAGFNGAQVGVSLGLGHMGADSRYTIEGGADASPINFTNNRLYWEHDTDHSKIHFSGGAFAKYTHMMGESTTIGLDIFARWQNVKSKNNITYPIAANSNADTEDKIFETDMLKSTVAFGGNLNIGMVMGSTHAYLKLGAVAARFKSTPSFKSSEQTTDDTLFPNAKGVDQYLPELKKTKVGFAPGLGMEYAVNENVMIALEATHEVFGKVDTTDIAEADALFVLDSSGNKANNTAGANARYLVKNRSFRPRNTRIALNIGYKFM